MKTDRNIGRMAMRAPERRPSRPPGTVLALAVLALMLLWGCAGAPASPEPANRQTPMAVSAAPGPGVGRLTDGREGFYINEKCNLDAETRQVFDRAVALLEAGDFQGGIPLLETVVEKSPGVSGPYIDLAIAYRAVGAPEKAETNLKTALDLIADHPVALNEYGLLLRAGGRFAEARAAYERAAASFPEYFPVHRNLAILCDIYLNDPVCALEHYEIYSAAKPEDKQVKLWVADLRTRHGGGAAAGKE